MIAVVVPVFNAPAETERCLHALAANVPDHTPVVVIDDASDDPRLEKILEQQPKHWYRVQNERNLGFVATANLGMAMAGDADIVLLNADTQVTSGWLEAIDRCAASDPRIASVTPLTNNGEIASIPEFCRANRWPDEPERWALACRDSGAPVYTEVPTAVGFCMYLRRACLDRIGEFDESAFGRGYGEENDWCMRAITKGWRHVLCDDAFVAHQGGASFGPLGLTPGGQAMQTLLNRYPDYMDRVRTLIETDPMAERRAAIVRRYRELDAG